jgi:hypothetical protein
LENDASYQDIQNVFSALGKIAREVVFVPLVHFETAVMPHLGILQRALVYNQSLSMYKVPISVSFESSWFLDRKMKKMLEIGIYGTAKMAYFIFDLTTPNIIELHYISINFDSQIYSNDDKKLIFQKKVRKIGKFSI